MMYCRFRDPEGTHYGRVERLPEGLFVTALLPPPQEDKDHGSAALVREQQIEPRRLADVDLLAPVLPSKIVCVGRNYREHAAELGNQPPQAPLLFWKPPSALIGPEAEIVLPPPALAERVDFEGELAVVIGRRCRNLRQGEVVADYVRGFTCANDVTARDLQKKDGQWTRAKGFDTFCPVGPIVAAAMDPAAGVELITRLNGEIRQRGNTRDFIFPLEHILQYVSQFTTLEPGDLVLTGTPSGVGPMKHGDIVEVEVEGIGILRNRVVADTLEAEQS